MEKLIRHDGIIESMSEDKVRVRIVQTSACNDCKVASHCHTAGAKEKIVEVGTINGSQRWQSGQHVVVTTQALMAGKALLIGFGLPLMLMLLVLVIAMTTGCSEGTTALLMLGSLVPYYIIVWLLRDKISSQITFRIEE